MRNSKLEKATEIHPERGEGDEQDVKDWTWFVLEWPADGQVPLGRDRGHHEDRGGDADVAKRP